MKYLISKSFPASKGIPTYCAARFRLRIRLRRETESRELQHTLLISAEIQRFELYNIRNDISEKTDLAEKEPERFARMNKQMTVLFTEVIAEGQHGLLNPKKRKRKKREN